MIKSKKTILTFLVLITSFIYSIFLIDPDYVVADSSCPTYQESIIKNGWVDLGVIGGWRRRVKLFDFGQLPPGFEAYGDRIIPSWDLDRSMNPGVWILIRSCDLPPGATSIPVFSDCPTYDDIICSKGWKNMGSSENGGKRVNLSDFGQLPVGFEALGDRSIPSGDLDRSMNPGEWNIFRVCT